MIRPLTRTPRGKAGRYKPMKTLTIFLIFVIGLILSSSSALSQHPSEAVKRGFSVIGVWRYQGGEEKAMEIHFLADHKAIFKGGYAFYNAAKWYFNPATAELRLIVPKMKQDDFKLFNQWTNTGLKINLKEKTIVYTLRDARLCFMGYFFEKEKK